MTGIQSLTLLDFPGRTACTLFLSGCNFRCPYCHNAPLLTERLPLIPIEELFSFLERRRSLLDGVCVTGGEPLLYPGLLSLLREIRARGFAVKLDTNGSRPDVLAQVLEEGLADYVAMDIKNAPDRYGETVGVAKLDLSLICESISLLKTQPCKFEFRTTVTAELHDASAFYAMGTWLAGAPKWFLQPYRDSDTVLCSGLTTPSRKTLMTYLNIARAYVPDTFLRGIDETEETGVTY